jgi:hypothetical protein
MSNFKCEYCQSVQSTKGSLKRHQQTSKTCIKNQESKGVFDNKIPVCVYCKKEFYSLKLKDHMDICVLRPIIDKTSTPISLDTPVINSTNYSSNSIDGNNNSIDNSVNINNININLDFGKFFTDEKIEEIFQEYKTEHALDQMKGLAKFIVKNILLLENSPGYYVRDVMRNIYQYETDVGLKTDENGYILRTKIKDGAGEYINGLVDQLIFQYSVLNGKKNEKKMEEMKIFKKDIEELSIEPKLSNAIKKRYTCKNKKDREEIIKFEVESKNKQNIKIKEIEEQKKIEKERQRKIKLYKFNLDRDRPNVVLSKNKNDPLEYSDKPKLEKLGLIAGDLFLEDILV